MIAKRDELFFRKDKRCGFIILEEEREKLLNCRAIEKDVVVKKLSKVVFCIRKSLKHHNKIIRMRID